VGLTDIGWKVEDFIFVAQDGKKWQAVVNTVMNIRVA
jgi:hypothetical protein